MVNLDFADIQGNILRGYGYPTAVYLFYKVPDPVSGRAFLAEIVGRLQNGERWEQPGPATATNLAVTYAGLQALGVPATILDTLPPAFREPIRERARRLLDDTGPSAPEHWDPVGTERSHLLVTVNGRERPKDEIPDKDFVEETAAVVAMAERHGLQDVHRQDALALDKRREHFGWADGFSQPAVEGAHGTKKLGDGVPLAGGGWRDLAAGEFVHGYPDEDGQRISGPAADLLRNGTYMVYRKLYQDIVAFRIQLREDALSYGRSLPDGSQLDPDQLYELMAAKVVGRWRDGEPIEISPRRSDEDSRHLGNAAEKEPSNDFRYRSKPQFDDERGFRCPIGAHIRRTNPRDALGWDGALSVRHRIIRRGMPYGPFLKFEQGQKDDGEDRGLIFVCFNTSLERQFEVIQRQWCIDGNAFGLGNDKDYLLGDTGVGLPRTGEAGGGPTCPEDGRISTGRVIIQGEPPRLIEARPPVVRTKGCEYLLMPGLEAVRDLARGRWDDGTAPPPGEQAAIDRVAELTRSKHERDYAPNIRPMLRDQHAKPHGCVRAEFTVSPDVPAHLRYGLLAEPGTYQAWIRFSSSASGPNLPSDRKRDAHGMAVKLLGVEGPKVLDGERDATTQDFILANSRVFFCRNPQEYVELATRANEGKLLRFFFGWNPAKWRLRLLVNLLVATKRAVHNPLQIQYWSQTPAALGPFAVKYSAKPQAGGLNRKPSSQGDNYLEDAMRKQLAAGEGRFDFMVQLQGDPDRMPVEDPTIRWSERASPFLTVATIRIPRQEFTSEAQKVFAENLSFTPWHSLLEHRPLGGINRVRRDVYEDISKRRHEANGVPRREPTPDEVF
jgi:Dyp-type peroxidase family